MNLILDDHPVVRQGLMAMLKNYKPDMEILLAGTVSEALELMKNNKIEMAFVDLYLNKESGFDFLEKIRKNNCDIKVFMITSSSKKSDFIRAKDMGVDAYVLKDAFVEEIVYGMNVVEKGGKFYSQNILESINNRSDEEKLLDTLTERELEILSFMGEGYTNAMIGEQLMISEGTVKKHISNILGKLSLSNRVNAVIFANKYNILSTREKM